MKVINKNKKSVLLEDKDSYRFFVERETYENAESEEELLEKSIPQSLSFSSAIEGIAKEQSSAIEKVLYVSGIHTKEDVLNQRKQVNDVLRRYFSAENIIRFIDK